MELRQSIDAVGEDRFRAACEWAWRTAAGTGARREPDRWPAGLSDVPHDLADLWEDPELPMIDKLLLAQALYRQMPCYALLMYVKHAYDGFGVEEVAVFWSEYRRLLEHADDRLADPVAYSLWVDFFEDPATVQQAWIECSSEVATQSATRRIERVLHASGPVPYAVKSQLYERLATERRWHDHIARGLVGSAFDTYGDLDLGAASALLARLQISEDAAGIAQLRERLARSPR